MNPENQLKTEQKNPLGETIRVTDSYQHSTCYLHDAHGNLVRVGRSTSEVCGWPFAETLSTIDDNPGHPENAESQNNPGRP